MEKASSASLHSCLLCSATCASCKRCYASPTSPTSHPQRRAPIATWRQDCADGHWASPAVATLWIELRLARLRDLQLTLQQAREKVSLVYTKRQRCMVCNAQCECIHEESTPSLLGWRWGCIGGDGLWCMVQCDITRPGSHNNLPGLGREEELPTVQLLFSD